MLALFRGFGGLLLLLQLVGDGEATSQLCFREGAVRLADGGRVEICFNRRWNNVCYSDYGTVWGPLEALVMCRQLGFNYSVPLHTYDGGDITQVATVTCIGDEIRLIHCDPEQIRYCYKYAGVVCTNTSECNETDVRLVDGETPDDGRVEICFGGVWGSVCDDGWDGRDAAVVCQQLGYSRSSIAVKRHEVISDVSFLYHLYDVACEGHEATLSECRHAGLRVHDCSGRNGKAGVICNRTLPQRECNETDVRLVDGRTPDDGRVEICLNGLWGSVCDDYWDSNDARVVCRQKGYNGSSIALHRHVVISTESLFYHLDDVACEGHEATLSECGHAGLGVHDCSERYEEAGVICSNKPECNETDVRLVDGATQEDGRVEICLGGLWGSVCDTNWDAKDARVVCRQLGYDGSSIALRRHHVESNESLFYHLDNVVVVDTKEN